MAWHAKVEIHGAEKDGFYNLVRSMCRPCEDEANIYYDTCVYLGAAYEGNTCEGSSDINYHSRSEHLKNVHFTDFMAIALS